MLKVILAVLVLAVVAMAQSDTVPFGGQVDAQGRQTDGVYEKTLNAQWPIFTQDTVRAYYVLFRKNHAAATVTITGDCARIGGFKFIKDYKDTLANDTIHRSTYLSNVGLVFRTRVQCDTCSRK